MHKSRLAGFIIDCQTDDLAAAAAFWGFAIGMAPRTLPGDEGERDVELMEAIGAKRVRQIKTWWVMEAPTGQRFCVVRSRSEQFSEVAHVWA